MKYYEVTFTLSPYAADAADVLAAVASEAGFETFEETPTGTIGYVQQQLFDQQALDSVIADFPFPSIAITYTVAEAEDRDWNEQWEQEGFEPIEVRGLTADGASRTLVIHDGRHLPDDAHAADISIEIDAHLAFGTGTHETTRMICATLLANEECRMKNEELSGGIICQTSASSVAYVNGVSEEIFKIGMCLPAGPYVSDDDVKYIVEMIKSAII